MEIHGVYTDIYGYFMVCQGIYANLPCPPHALYVGIRKLTVVKPDCSAADLKFRTKFCQSGSTTTGLAVPPEYPPVTLPPRASAREGRWRAGLGTQRPALLWVDCPVRGYLVSVGIGCRTPTPIWKMIDVIHCSCFAKVWSKPTRT